MIEREDIIKGYKKYVTERHLKILKMIKKKKDPRLLRIYKIKRDYHHKDIIHLQMERGLVLPIV
jgi:hypothetical protein